MARMTALNLLLRKITLLVERANKPNVYLTIGLPASQDLAEKDRNAYQVPRDYLN